MQAAMLLVAKTHDWAEFRGKTQRDRSISPLSRLQILSFKPNYPDPGGFEQTGQELP
jgi:hypothetical protein